MAAKNPAAPKPSKKTKPTAAPKLAAKPTAAPKPAAKPKAALKGKPTQSPKQARAKKPVALALDPTSDDALLALDASFAAAPDIPVAVAQREFASLARLARVQLARLAKIGISSDKIDTLALFARRLGALEKSWQRARRAVNLTVEQQKLRGEAEALDEKLVAGGRWACRKDSAAQTELSRIAEGSGLNDTIQDLRDLVTFWSDHEDRLGDTDITQQDLARASKLADALEGAAANEASDLGAARAIELRNRGFWAADELAKDIREGGRYAFRQEPKIAAKFVSRYRASASRRSRRKSKALKTSAGPKPRQGADT